MGLASLLENLKRGKKKWRKNTWDSAKPKWIWAKSVVKRCVFLKESNPCFWLIYNDLIKMSCNESYSGSSNSFKLLKSISKHFFLVWLKMNSNSKRSTKVNKILRSHHFETECKLCNFSLSILKHLNGYRMFNSVGDFGLYNYRQSSKNHANLLGTDFFKCYLAYLL